MKYRNAIFIVLLILLADQALKIYVKTHFHYGEEVRVAGNWFRLYFIENEGMAFGMKFGQAAIAKLFLTLFRLAAVIFGFFLLKRLTVKKYSKGLIVCGSLILAGAAGNLIDCIFYGQVFTDSLYDISRFVPFGKGYGALFHGKVVDMFYFPLIDTRLPTWLPFLGGERFSFFDEIFNLADAAICTGIGVLVVFQKKLLQKHKQEEKAAVPTVSP